MLRGLAGQRAGDDDAPARASTRICTTCRALCLGRCAYFFSPAVGVVLDVDGIVHRRGGGVSFFESGDFSFVLEAGADVVETLQQDFFAGRRDVEVVEQAVLVADRLAWQIDRQRVAFFFFRTLEQLFDFFFGYR